MYKENKRNAGITLIALVITIIVLLILATISITMLTGDNAILNRATNARTQTIHANVYEQLQIEALAYLTDKTTSKTSSTLIEYLQSKSIIENEIGENTGKYQINVTALLGSKQSLGNGDATVELKDVYMLEKQNPQEGSIVNTKVATTTPIQIAATSTNQITYKVEYYGNGASEFSTLGSLIDSNASSDIPVSNFGYNATENCFIGQKSVGKITEGVEDNTQKLNWDANKNGYKFTAGHFVYAPNYPYYGYNPDTGEIGNNVRNVYLCWDADDIGITTPSQRESTSGTWDIFDASSGAWLSIDYDGPVR